MAGGFFQADSYTNSAGTGAAPFPQGINSTVGQFTTGAVAGYVYSTDASGNGSWLPPGLGVVAANDSAVVFVAASSRIQTSLPTVDRTYTLPTTSILADDNWEFQNRSSTAVITLNASGGAAITTVPPKCTVRLVTLVATPTLATQWNVTYAQSAFTAYTLSITGGGVGTATGLVGKARRDGEFLEVIYAFVVGTAAASSAGLSVPWSVVLNTASIGITANAIGTIGSTLGYFASNTTNGNSGYLVTAPASSTSLIYIGQTYQQLAAVPSSSVSGTSLSTGSAVTGSFRIPIVGWALNAN